MSCTLNLISTFLFQKVRFAQEQEEKPPEPPKPEMKEVSVWTHEPEYDNYLYVRVHTPKNLKQTELKCMITFQNKILKTGRLDIVEEEEEVSIILDGLVYSEENNHAHYYHQPISLILYVSILCSCSIYTN